MPSSLGSIMLPSDMKSPLETTVRRIVVSACCAIAIIALVMSSTLSAQRTTGGDSQSDRSVVSSGVAAPTQQDGFYPPLPVPHLPVGGGTLPITVSLPNDFFDPSVPSSTVIIEPVTTTLIDSTT